MDKIISLIVLVIIQTTVFQIGINGQDTAIDKPKKACSGYGFNIWLSCITNPCIFATCPAFGRLAECRKEITGDCKTCRAAFYLNNRRVNCHLRIECPPELPLQKCASDPCSITQCHNERFKEAPCKGYYCGGCLAQYFVDDKWQQCPNPDIKIQGDAPLLLPEIRRAMHEFQPGDRRADSSVPANMCPDGTPELECPNDPCINAECPSYSRATCVVNKCNGCKAEFYLQGQLVNCNSKCRRNVLEMSCPDDPCKYAQCPSYPGAECRPNNCGYCHPEWFVNDRPVNCYSKLPANYQCPHGLTPRDCSNSTNICRFTRCYNDVNTYCRVNNCGNCFPEYINIKGEIVDCVGWWSMWEPKPPKEFRVANSGPTSLTNGGSQSSSAGKTAASETITVESKQKKIDDLFGNLGFEIPNNSQIVSSPMEVPPPPPSKSTTSTGNVNDPQNKIQKPKPVQLTISRKRVQIKPSDSQMTGSDASIPNSRPLTVPAKGNNLNTENRQPVDLFQSLPISLEALNRNQNFRPGVPIGGFNFRAGRR